VYVILVGMTAENSCVSLGNVFTCLLGRGVPAIAVGTIDVVVLVYVLFAVFVPRVAS
jgi:hypothetical protein